jgi:hypothetical protein
MVKKVAVSQQFCFLGRQKLEVGFSVSIVFRTISITHLERQYLYLEVVFSTERAFTRKRKYFLLFLSRTHGIIKQLQVVHQLSL